MRTLNYGLVAPGYLLAYYIPEAARLLNRKQGVDSSERLRVLTEKMFMTSVTS